MSVEKTEKTSEKITRESDSNEEIKEMISTVIGINDEGHVEKIGDVDTEDLSYPMQLAADMAGFGIKLIMEYESDDDTKGIYPTKMADLFADIRNQEVEKFKNYMLTNILTFISQLPEMDEMIDEMGEDQEEE